VFKSKQVYRRCLRDTKDSAYSFSAESSNQNKFIADVSEVRGTLRITQLACVDLFLLHFIQSILFVTKKYLFTFLCVSARRVPRTSETLRRTNT